MPTDPVMQALTDRSAYQEAYRDFMVAAALLQTDFEPARLKRLEACVRACLTAYNKCRQAWLQMPLSDGALVSRIMSGLTPKASRRVRGQRLSILTEYLTMLRDQLERQAGS